MRNNWCKLDEYGLAKWATKQSPYSNTDTKEHRTKFKHDEDEIIYSKSFKRLAHKSQIVVKPEKDHFRSRLTHTLEVKQIAESLSKLLYLNDDLIDAIALGHDLGHAPFGHAGEKKIQKICKNEILTLKYFTPGKLKKYRKPHSIFHHSENSVRIIQRKMKSVSNETISGIRTHSWSPWKKRKDLKFGIPITYEAQIVAVADQIASINHDTEDILSCPETEYDINKLHTGFIRYLKLHYHNLTEREIIDNLDIFLHKSNSNEGNGWGRKTRLQFVINDIYENTKNLFLNKYENGTEKINCQKSPIAISSKVAFFLEGYEKYIRDEIIKKVFWFKHRDKVAESTIGSVFCFLDHYKGRALTGLPANIKIIFDELEKCIVNDNYSGDKFYKSFKEDVRVNEVIKVERFMHIIDYISGMTDQKIIDIYKILSL